MTTRTTKQKTNHVCGMTITEESAADSSRYEGKDYLFCCSNCKATFDLHPEQYLTAKLAEKGGGCGCGCGPS